MVSLTTSNLRPGTLAPKLAARARSAVAEHGMAVALGLSVLGWSLLWAQALAIVSILPQWLCAGAFFGGMALIPFCSRSCSTTKSD